MNDRQKIAHYFALLRDQLDRAIYHGELAETEVQRLEKFLQTLAYQLEIKSDAAIHAIIWATEQK